jgi:hypothetical protein
MIFFALIYARRKTIGEQYALIPKASKSGADLDKKANEFLSAI